MLELKNIVFNEDNDGKNVGILRDISLTVGDNKFVVITGPNGGGKSTLAKVVAWYDNEYSYTCQMVKVVKYLCKDL